MVRQVSAAARSIVGVILAGGQSRRMGGGDKALLTVAEQSMLQRVIAHLDAHTDRLVLNANGDADRFRSFALPIVPDATPGLGGPLFGMLAGMRWAAQNTNAAWVVTVPADAPFLPADLVSRLAAELIGDAEVAVCCSGGRLHPIIGLWPVSLADTIETWLSDQPRRSAHAFLETRRHAAVDFAIVGGLDPFFNVNTPDDLAAARQLADGLP